MALLLSCWFIIEYILIPDGFAKWYCLSFFIHPFFLPFCQIFLWIKVVGTWLSFILSQPLRIVWFVSSWVFRFLKKHVNCLFSFAKSTNSDVLEEVTEIEIFENCNAFQSIVLYNCYRQIFDESKSRIEIGDELVNEVVVVLDGDEFVKEELVVVHDDSYLEESTVTHVDGDIDMDMDIDESNLSLSCSSESSNIVETEVENERSEEEEIDPFYMKYVEGMRWYDLLNNERTCGISSILNNQQNLEAAVTSLESSTIEPAMDFLILPHMSKMYKRKLIRSLESDIEKVYVGQTCLCWEALHHQYRKVEALLCSSPTTTTDHHDQNGFFYDNVAGYFQKFQVLLERFMENERAEGKRFWNYVEGRLSSKILLQVPEISGYCEEEKEGMKGQGMKAKDVLRAIENSIRAFWVFVHTDNKKSWWKFKSFLWTTCPPLEDPKDLDLLADLTKLLQKKELMLKDIERKKKCWLKRAYHQLEESQRREIFFCTIDMKLVSRVLKLSLISTPQLRWCLEKLNNIDFIEGNVVIKASTGCLFPP